MSAEWDLVGFVRRSQYRAAVVEYLADHGDAMPSEIADGTEYALSHVSRALTQLRNRDLVRLLVSEDRHRGRIYALTERGRSVALQMRRNLAVDWERVDRADFRHPDLVSFLESRLDDALRVVAYRESEVGQLVTVGVDEADLCQVCTRTLFCSPDPDLDTAVVDVSYRYAVRGFDRATVVHLLLDEDSHVGVAVAPSRAIELPSLADRCFDVLE